MKLKKHIPGFVVGFLLAGVIGFLFVRSVARDALDVVNLMQKAQLSGEAINAQISSRLTSDIVERLLERDYPEINEDLVVLRKQLLFRQGSLSTGIEAMDLYGEDVSKMEEQQERIDGLLAELPEPPPPSPEEPNRRRRVVLPE